MNVAVSRAKDAFVVVGDAGCLVEGSKSAAGLLKEFCRKSFIFLSGWAVEKIRLNLQKVADNNIIESKKGWDCHVKEI